MKTCRHCERTLRIQEFPLGRSRADGSREPFDYCTECLSSAQRTRTALRGGGAEARRRRNLDAINRFRKKVVANG